MFQAVIFGVEHLVEMQLDSTGVSLLFSDERIWVEEMYFGQLPRDKVMVPAKSQHDSVREHVHHTHTAHR